MAEQADPTPPDAVEPELTDEERAAAEAKLIEEQGQLSPEEGRELAARLAEETREKLEEIAAAEAKEHNAKRAVQFPDLTDRIDARADEAGFGRKKDGTLTKPAKVKPVDSAELEREAKKPGFIDTPKDRV